MLGGQSTVCVPGGSTMGKSERLATEVIRSLRDMGLELEDSERTILVECVGRVIGSPATLNGAGLSSYCRTYRHSACYGLRADRAGGPLMPCECLCGHQKRGFCKRCGRL